MSLSRDLQERPDEYDRADAATLRDLAAANRCMHREVTDGGRHYVYCGGYEREREALPYLTGRGVRLYCSRHAGSAGGAPLVPVWAERAERAHRVNRFIAEVASCGRRFFDHAGRAAPDRHPATRDGVSRFVVVWPREALRPPAEAGKPNGQPTLRFADAYTGALLSANRQNGRWKGFSQGGTLRSLVLRFQRYVMSGNNRYLLTAADVGPWPDWAAGGDVWGYGEAAMKRVRSKARDLSLYESAARR